jgi:hypothetical protein
VKLRIKSPRVWLFPRLWVADEHAVRLSLPWHGDASWASMHDYVTKVFTDNTVPNTGRAGYGTPEEQAASFARGILLSVCHRLSIEPVGAFDFHDPDKGPDGTRCPSCEHGAGIHAEDGCWYTVAHGKTDRNMVCACRMPREDIEDDH